MMDDGWLTMGDGLWVMGSFTPNKPKLFAFLCTPKLNPLALLFKSPRIAKRVSHRGGGYPLETLEVDCECLAGGHRVSKMFGAGTHLRRAKPRYPLETLEVDCECLAGGGVSTPL